MHLGTAVDIPFALKNAHLKRAFFNAKGIGTESRLVFEVVNSVFPGVVGGFPFFCFIPIAATRHNHITVLPMVTTTVEYDESIFHLSNPGQAYLSPSNQKNYQELVSGVQGGKQLFLITGEAGCGKSTLVRRVAYEMGDAVRLIGVHRGDLDFEAFIDYIGRELGAGFSDETPLAEKITAFSQLLHSQPTPHVIILIDQADKMEPDVLKEIYKLAGSEPGNALFIQIVMVGLPGLDKQLEESGLGEIDPDKIVHCQLERLSSDEVVAYIRFYLGRLKDQGENLFSDEALKRIDFYSRGIPRQINRLCGLGLLAASLADEKTVTGELVDEVSGDCLSLRSGSDITTSPETRILDSAPTELLPKIDIEEPTEILKPSDDERTILRDDVERAPRAIPPAVLMDEDDSTQLIQTKVVEAPEESNNTSISTAFALGVLVSALAGTGLYFLSDSDNENISSQVESEETTRLQETTSGQRSNAETSASKTLRENSSQYEDQPSQATSVEPAVRFENPIKVEEKPWVKERKITEFLALAEKQLASNLRPENDKALGSYRKILELDPNHAQALAGIVKIKKIYAGWARREASRGNFKQAEVFYGKALKVSPGAPDILAALSRVKKKLRAGQSKTSYKSVAKISKKDEGSRKVVTEIPKQNGEKKSIGALLERANRQLSEKKLMTPIEDSAWSTYQEVLAVAPNHKDARAGIVKIKETYTLWARHEVEKGDYKHAEFLYRKALEIFPNDTGILAALKQLKETSTSDGLEEVRNSYVLWARNEIVKGNYKRAEYHYQKALEVFPEDIKILAALARVKEMRLAKTQKPTDFLAAEFSEPIFTKKGLEDLLKFAEEQIARKRLTKPDGNSALSVYQRILNRVPGHPKALTGIKKITDTYAMWARHEVRKGNYQHAEYLYRKALEVTPSDHNVLFALKQLKGDEKSRVKVKVLAD